jgi:hypothetical protein
VPQEYTIQGAGASEVLRALQLWGLVEARQGGGNYIRIPSIERITTPLSTIIGHNRQV